MFFLHIFGIFLSRAIYNLSMRNFTFFSLHEKWILGQKSAKKKQIFFFKFIVKFVLKCLKTRARSQIILRLYHRQTQIREIKIVLFTLFDSFYYSDIFFLFVSHVFAAYFFFIKNAIFFIKLRTEMRKLMIALIVSCTYKEY